MSEPVEPILPEAEAPTPSNGEPSYSIRKTAQPGNPFDWLEKLRSMDGAFGIKPFAHQSFGLGLPGGAAGFLPMGTDIGKTIFPNLSWLREFSQGLNPLVPSSVGDDFQKAWSQFASRPRIASDLFKAAGMGLGREWRLGLKTPSFDWAGQKTAIQLSGLTRSSIFRAQLKELFSAQSNLPRPFAQHIKALQRSNVGEALNDSDAESLEWLWGSAQEFHIDPGNVAESEGTYEVARPDDAEKQLIQTLEAQSKHGQLPRQALAMLLAFILASAWLYDQIAQWHDFRESACDLNSRILTAPSFRDVRNAVHSFACGMPDSVRAQMRLVAHNNVSLRDEPRMKSSIILKLPMYSQVEILESQGSRWIRVLYKQEGLEVAGWMSRSMVRTIPGR